METGEILDPFTAGGDETDQTAMDMEKTWFKTK